MDIFPTIAKVCSVIISIILAAAAVVAEFIGLLLISPYSFSGLDSVNGFVFLQGMLLIAAAIVLPIVINRKLYRVWYSEEELSEKWVKIPNAIICTITLGIFVYAMLFSNYIYGWLNTDWYW